MAIFRTRISDAFLLEVHQLRTEALEFDWLTIRIADNDPGISEEVNLGYDPGD